MKNLKLVVLFALVFNLVAVSCKSDDDNDTVASENTMTIDGEQFDVEVGFLSEFGANGDGSFDWDVVLFSDGFTIDTAEEEITGVGASLYLDLNTNSATGLVPGTYIFSNEIAEFTWVDAEGVINFNAETGNGTFFSAVSGTVVISGTGSDQLIVANLVDANGNALTASYRGLLQIL
ncbi:hypothetical protein [uncultured Dokdonia sp.]|uniref:hypothetical protein n=1 Tax=uncultured Dokdonia sp. TaxID=575653 RepID=UPI0026177CC2|nr:hypothetical protein [uncultured Dokdonia sp.]